jgi:hypothetical protein
MKNGKLIIESNFKDTENSTWKGNSREIMGTISKEVIQWIYRH